MQFYNPQSAVILNGGMFFAKFYNPQSAVIFLSQFLQLYFIVIAIPFLFFFLITFFSQGIKYRGLKDVLGKW